jgi:cytochrome c553
MKNKRCYVLAVALVVLSCTKKTYVSNGEKIYKTGKNLQGERMLDKPASRIKIVGSCQGCHGKNGDRMNGVSIKFSYLSDPANFAIPYNDSLFYRFLAKDLNSNGTKANIGVIWKMSDQDKKDLLAYLKTL